MSRIFKIIIRKQLNFFIYLKGYLKFIGIKSLNNDKLLNIYLEGGLGDIIMATHYVSSIKRVRPNTIISVYYRDDDTISNPKEYSYGITRKYKGDNHRIINPISEWIEAIYNVDASTGCNPALVDQKIYRLYSPHINKFQSYISPSDFDKSYLVQYFSNRAINENCNKILKYINRQKVKKRIVSVHLRRNSDIILEFCKIIQSRFEITFLVLGSTEHQIIPNYDFLHDKIILIDSYSKKLDLLDIFHLTRNSDLFIGGRGGFELFHWLACVPSINFFDKVGFLEVENKLWPKVLWNENKIPEIFDENSNLQIIYQKYFKNGWLNEDGNNAL